MHKVENDHGVVSEPYHIGRAGKLLRDRQGLHAAGAVGAAVLGGRRWGAVASGALLAAGSALTRFGVFDAGDGVVQGPEVRRDPAARAHGRPRRGGRVAAG